MTSIYVFDSRESTKHDIDSEDPVIVNAFIKGLDGGRSRYSHLTHSQLWIYEGLVGISQTTGKITYYEPIDPNFFTEVEINDIEYATDPKNDNKYIKPLAIKLFLEAPRREMTAYIASLNRKEKTPYFPTNQGTRHSYSSSVFESIFDNLVIEHIRQVFVRMVEHLKENFEDFGDATEHGDQQQLFLHNFDELVAALPSFSDKWTGGTNADFQAWQVKYASTDEHAATPLAFGVFRDEEDDEAEGTAIDSSDDENEFEQDIFEQEH